MNYDRTANRSAAVTTLTTAVQHEHDFAGWLADVLAAVAARHGSSYALVAGRPGSWEASLVTHLVRGTAGWDDEHLDSYRDNDQDTANDTAPVIVSPGAADAMELAQLLEFLDDWLAAGHHPVSDSLARFTGSEAYGSETLRDDLARFIILLSGCDREGPSTHTFE